MNSLDQNLTIIGEPTANKLIAYSLIEEFSERKSQKTFKQTYIELVVFPEDMLTTSKIAKILERLKDGEWHSLKEIQQEIKLMEYQIQQIITFLKEYDLIIVDERENKVKIKKFVQRFLTQTTP